MKQIPFEQRCEKARSNCRKHNTRPNSERDKVVALAKRMLAENPATTKSDVMVAARNNGIQLSKSTMDTYLSNLCLSRDITPGMARRGADELYDRGYKTAALGARFHQLLPVSNWQ